jgi:hypothetical protein
MTIQERDADLQYVRQQLSNQTGRTKDTAERYSKEQERLRVVLYLSNYNTNNNFKIFYTLANSYIILSRNWIRFDMNLNVYGLNLKCFMMN